MSIDLAMWFALGFLVAALLALLAMGAVWRRAVRLTTRRVRAALPADLDEIEAEADLRAARHARDTRRLELALADLRRRNADERATVGRQRADVERLFDALDEARRTGAAAAATIGERDEALAERDRRIETLTAAYEAAQAEAVRTAAALSEREAATDRLIQDHERRLADVAQSHRAATAELELRLEGAAAAARADVVDARAEIATRAATIAAHEAQIRSLRLQVAEAAALLEAEKTAHRLADTATAQERDRADRLDRRIARLVADVADREDRVARMERELDRARQAVVFANARAAAGSTGEAPAGDNLLRSLTQLEARNHELEDRLAALGGARAAAPSGTEVDPQTRDELRGALADLAARIVRLTRVAEGETSPLDRILTTTAPATGLAARIRALEAKADAGTRVEDEIGAM